jgi:simple sugar transport system permease protein
MNSMAQKIKNAVLTVLIACVLTTAVAVMAGISNPETFTAILNASLGSESSVSQVIKAWIPMTICACGLLFAFRAGLWNIGAEGQIALGAVAAAAVFKMDPGADLAAASMIAAALASVAGGAIWAIVTGWVKTKTGLHEIFTGLGMNFIAQAVVLWLISGPWKKSGASSSVNCTETIHKDLWLPFSDFCGIYSTGFVLTVAAVIFTAVFLKYTKTGLRLKAMRLCPDAAHMYRINIPSYILTITFISGGFAGLAGFFQLSGIFHRLEPSISGNYGYLAIPVVLFSNFNAWIVPFAALFFACITTGAAQLPMEMKTDPAISGVIQGCLVISTLAVQAWHTRKPTMDKQYKYPMEQIDNDKDKT